MENHFILTAEEYTKTRDLNIVGNYIEDAALFLHKRTGKPLEQCKDYVVKVTGVNGKYRLQDPDVLSLTKHTPGNREKEVIPFSLYLKEVVEGDMVISPTMAVYVPAKVKVSILSEFIDNNIKRRSKSKKEMFAAKMRHDELLETFKNNEQTSFKISNNSLSGAQASTGTILYNKSAHSTLTSTCRTATSYANANNEKFLFGNRHYWNPDIVKNNIISIVRNTDYVSLTKTLETYGIVHPTVEQTMDCITYSTDLYWKRSKKVITEIEQLVRGLTDIERSAFVYTGDFYHLAKYNPEIMREFLTRITIKDTSIVDNPTGYLDELNEDSLAYVSLLCAKEINGRPLFEVLGKKEDVPRDDVTVNILGATAKNLINTLNHYQYLIKGLWRVRSLPASVANIRSSLRRGVVTSDTDSTIFSTQYWTEWYVGKIDFSEQSKAVSYAMTYLVTQNVAHILATISASMGVDEKQMFKLAMKNEFAFPVFVLTSIAKHYFAFISAQEGNVYKEMDMEVKGVQLKDSNIPPHIMEAFKERLKDIMTSVMEGKMLSIEDLKKRVSTIEYDIINSVKRGDSRYLTGTNIKEKGSYVNPLSSPFAHYLMWQEVFAPKYGDAPEPPYQAVKVSVELDNNTKLKLWLNGLTDVGVRDRMESYLKNSKKNGVKTLILPRSLIESNGIPDEIISAMNIRKLVYSCVRPYYLLMESLGFYMVNDNLTKLVSDLVPPYSEEELNMLDRK
ncbi:MAG: hypothetical protein IBX57_00140 [Gammaproteobacteria bacterium]|nr:hypothetical protein [Gammaproteobacteria bacterium]